MNVDVVEVTPSEAPGACAARRWRQGYGPRRVTAVPEISPWLWRLFGRYARHYISRSFHAVRLCRAGPPPVVSDWPLVIFLNHPSWWDPLLCLFLAQRFFSDRRHYAPMHASALARYRFFARLGFFGVVPGTRQGAQTFVRTSQAILQQAGTALWLTPEGQFTDPRQRPVHLQPGISYLARYMPDVTYVPLALEYPFWEERLPEVLVRFGAPIQLDPETPRDVATDTARLAAQLQKTQDKLAAAACKREVDDFDVILRGRAGMGGIYEAWCAWRYRLRGERFRRAHGEK